MARGLADGVRSRRSVIGGGLATFGGIALVSRAGALEPTGPMTIGPFYPVIRPLDTDGDLTRINGMAVAARGQIIHVTGRVLDVHGRSVSGARLELWQCNADGRYQHPADASGNPTDDGFQGFGIQTADAEGRFHFKTVKPAAYAVPGGRNIMRAPHLHFDVVGKRTRVVTQMHFPGEPLNTDDIVLNTKGDKAPYIAQAAPSLSTDPKALAFAWDVVLASG